MSEIDDELLLFMIFNILFKDVLKDNQKLIKKVRYFFLFHKIAVPLYVEWSKMKTPFIFCE